MEIPLFHGRRNEETTEKKEDRAVEIDGGRGFAFLNAKQREQDHGPKPVAESGIASVTHQVAISTATPAMRVTMGFPGQRSRNRVKKNSTNPRIRPTL